MGRYEILVKRVLGQAGPGVNAEGDCVPLGECG